MPQNSSFTPQCDENLKPKIGIIFEGLEAIEELYKSYAHDVGFGVNGRRQRISLFELNVLCVTGKDSSPKMVR